MFYFFKSTIRSKRAAGSGPCFECVFLNAVEGVNRSTFRMPINPINFANKPAARGGGSRKSVVFQKNIKTSWRTLSHINFGTLVTHHQLTKRRSGRAPRVGGALRAL